MGQGLSQARWTKVQQAALEAPFPDDAIDLLPSGEIYVSQEHLRHRLNQVFGVGAWGLDPRSDVRIIAEKGQLAQAYVLVVEGRVATRIVWGEAQYHETNVRASWPRAIEACASIAIRRACKDIGVGLTCWNRRFAYRFRLQYGVLVLVQDREGKQRRQWRRYDDPPFPYEIAIAHSSPNQNQYAKPPTEAQREAAKFDTDEEAVPSQPAAKPSLGEQTQTGQPGRLNQQAITRLWSLATKHKRSKDDIHGYIRELYGVASTKDLTPAAYEETIRWIQQP